MLKIDNKLLDQKEEQKKKLIYILAIALITTSVFIYSVEIRDPWFGNLYDKNHHWLSGSTLKFADNWYNEGPENLYWGMIENPKSVEFTSLLSRDPYPSYPPGVIIPIYLISKIINQEPNPSILMGYNLINHFLIAFLMALLVFIFLSRNLGYDLKISFLFSVIPIFLQILWPAPLYWHQNVFFSDQAIILPFVLVVFLEILRYDSSKINLKYISVAQGFLIFFGFLTDWLFVFITASIFIKRLFTGEIPLNHKKLPHKIPFITKRFIKKSLMFWGPGLLAMILFFVQLEFLGVLGELRSKFFMRAGVSILPGSEKNIFDIFIGFIGLGYGKVAELVLLITVYLLIVVSILFLYKKLKNQRVNLKLRKIICLLWLVYLPCFTQFFFLKSHSMFHEFSILKFSFPIAISFVLMPIILYLLALDFRKIEFESKKARKILLIFLIASFLLMSSSLFLNNSERLNLFDVGPSYDQMGNASLANFIKENTVYDDVVFSPDFEIPENPPQFLFYSMKRVYKVNSTDDIKTKLENVSGYCDIVLIFLKPPSGKWKKVITNAKLISDDKYYLYRLKASDLP